MNSKVKMKKFATLLCVVLAFAVAAGIISVGGFTLSANAEQDPIAAHAPEGMANLATKASVTISTIAGNPFNSATHENSYQEPNDGWEKKLLNDGVVQSSGGYTTDPYEGGTGNSTDASCVEGPLTVTFDLGDIFRLGRITMFPAKNAASLFPSDYTVSVSEDGTEYTTVVTESNYTMESDADGKDHSLDAVQARYVRLHVTKRNNANNKMSQFAEICIYGKNTGTVLLNKNKLELEVGQSDVIKIAETGITPDTVTWTSDSEQTATVSGGEITAVAEGKATVTVRVPSRDSATIDVTVVNKKKSFDDNILVSVFWPPTLSYMSGGEGDERWAEQYDLLADAHIDFLNNVTSTDLGDTQVNLKMAQYAYERGMRISVSDYRFGSSLLGKTEAEIGDIISEYRNVPGVAGYYILDEPMNPNAYADIYNYIKKADPASYAHLNFLPYYAYDNITQYKAQMHDWLSVTTANGCEQDYLMYDLYPYPDGNGMNRERFFANMQAVWQVGLMHGVKTGTYLQAVRIPGAYRCPTVAEIRYEAMASLAYGFKQLSYFTWFTPRDTAAESFVDGIISRDGIPNAKTYEGIKQLNSEIHALGNTLIGLDAKEVYLNGDTWGMESVPADFFAQPTDGANYLVSYLRDKKTGANYMMVVNNLYDVQNTVCLKLDAAIGGLKRISATDGTLSAVELGDGNTLTVTLEAGDGALFALPEGYDREQPRTPQIGENLAATASIIVDSSMGSDYAYIAYLNDGLKYCSANRRNQGWRSTKPTATLTLDLGIVSDVNRLDLYPAGINWVAYGDGAPKNFTVKLSADGENWTDVKTVQNMRADAPQSFTFDTVSARYMKIDITEGYSSYIALAEIEVYNDDGSVPPPPESVFTDPVKDVDFVAGANIALKKSVYVSSTTPQATHAQFGWWKDYVNDGDISNGWTSNIAIHPTENGEEWVMVDFGDVFAVNKIKLYCKDGTHFPVDYRVQLSEDRQLWNDVAAVTGDEGTEGWREYTLDTPVAARYVRVHATKLAFGGNPNDGYLMQINEMEAYGAPVISDIATAQNVLAQVSGLLTSAEDDTAEFSALEAAIAAASENNVTQKRLNTKVEAARNKFDTLVATDLSAAQNRLAEVDKADLTGKDTAALDAAVAELRAALEGTVSKSKLAALTEAVQSELKKLSADDDTPENPTNPDDNPDNPGDNPGDNTGDDNPDNPGDNTGDDNPDNPGDNTGDDNPDNPGDNTGDADNNGNASDKTPEQEGNKPAKKKRCGSAVFGFNAAAGAILLLIGAVLVSVRRKNRNSVK